MVGMANDITGNRRGAGSVARHAHPGSIVEIASVNVFAAFVFGALSFLSPCVLPLLPGYLSMMSGYSASELSEGKTSMGRMLRVTLLFVGGVPLGFIVLAATPTSLGPPLPPR